MISPRLLAVCLLLSCCATAQTIATTSRNGLVPKASLPHHAGAESSTNAAQDANSNQNDNAAGKSRSSVFDSLGFGVALSLQWNVFKPDIVNDASIDPNGIVRVDTRSNTSAGLGLEMHYLVKKWKKDTVGFGPFVAVQPGTDQVISSVGMGGMINWKVNTSDSKDRKGFGLGFGYAARPSAKVLGEEFVDGKPAPIGPGGQPIPIRFQTRDKGSVLILLAFTF